ncbi:glutathione S-transferase family protein [Wenzhouxiangella marina]|uniref:glutathione transferase n=1 Tax=Wenzhouxiangella marina TaxID=1579979 RepID=A0A0K0XU06_9GAMM|nr:glutathione S-transferase [Wenzhouxiangella marina]AKS41163.1 Glutathione S-transferase, N-terminal domain [Wenzhouxiangella marina]MBB6088042.1 glutathione S-transferase [Wenzhouxiangella marina]
MITVHHLEHSRSQRVLWMLEELGAEYEIKRYERDPETRLAPPSLKKVHPLGKSPVVVDDGRVVAESGTILEYLARKHGKGRWAPAATSDAYWDFSYWMHYAEGSLMPPLLLRLVFDMVSTRSPLLIKPLAKGISAQVGKAFINPQIRTHLDFVESHLDGRDWFVGDRISAADVQMCFPLEAANARGLIGEQRPNIRAFVDRCHSRPAYLRALEAGGPYDYGPA